MKECLDFNDSDIWAFDTIGIVAMHGYEQCGQQCLRQCFEHCSWHCSQQCYKQCHA